MMTEASVHECELIEDVLDTYEIKLPSGRKVNVKCVPILRCEECREVSFWPEVTRLMVRLAEASTVECFEYPGHQTMSPEQIREIRGELRVSQPRLAALLGRSAITVSHWETGRKKPDGSSLVALRLMHVLARRASLPMQGIQSIATGDVLPVAGGAMQRQQVVVPPSRESLPRRRSEPSDQEVLGQALALSQGPSTSHSFQVTASAQNAGEPCGSQRKVRHVEVQLAS